MISCVRDCGCPPRAERGCKPALCLSQSIAHAAPEHRAGKRERAELQKRARSCSLSLSLSLCGPLSGTVSLQHSEVDTIAEAKDGSADGIWDSWVHQATQQLEERGLLRQLVPVTPTGCAMRVIAPCVCVCVFVCVCSVRVLILPERACLVQARWPHQGDRTVLSFALNDYLGLAAHARVQQAMASAAQQLGTGAPLASCSYACHSLALS